MDYYGVGYNDYRSGGSTSAYHHSSSYGSQHSQMGRYGPTPPSSYRSGMSRSSAMYDTSFDRYGYANASHNGYNSSPYGYNHAPEMRPNNNYYANQQHHHSYESSSSSMYRNANGMMSNGHAATATASGVGSGVSGGMPMPATTGPSYAPYRDPYGNEAAMYRSKSNYQMRSPSYQQYPANRDYNYYGGYGAQSAMPNDGNIDIAMSTPIMHHHHNGYAPLEYGQNPAAAMQPYPQDGNGYAMPMGLNGATGMHRYILNRKFN